LCSECQGVLTQLENGTSQYIVIQIVT